MDALAMYNSALQVAAAFLIFIVGYLALLIIIVVCLLAAEGVRQGFIFARASLTRSALDPKAPSAPVGEIVNRSSAFWTWMHRLTEAPAGNPRPR
jgi:hypothetical protein